jgi:hypothetical protein
MIANGFDVEMIWDFTGGSLGRLRFLGNLRRNDVGHEGEWDVIQHHQVIAGTQENIFSAITGSTLGNVTPGEPVGRAVIFRGTQTDDHLFIPLGANGYAAIGQSTSFFLHAADASHPAAQAFCVLGSVLICLDIDGQLFHSEDGFTWASYGDYGLLPSSITGHDLVLYFDRNGYPAVFVVGDSMIMQFDPDTPALGNVDVEFPSHKYQGLAACKWRGDLYFSVGNGVHRYTGGALSSVGLDRDHGLPITHAGHIVEGGLVPGYNALYAFVTAPDFTDKTFTETPDPVPVSGVYEYNSLGWHMIWEGASGEVITPNSMGIARGDEAAAPFDGFALYWGVESTTGNHGKLYRILLPVEFANPRQRARVTGGFADSGYLESSMFDAGMRGYLKVANALDVSIAAIPADATLTVSYRTSLNDDYTVLGTVTTTGTTSLPFGDLLNDIYPGFVFERIQFYFALAGAGSAAFLMESAVLSFVKTVPPSYAFTAQLDLAYAYEGHSPEQMRQHIDAILADRVFVPMVFRGVTYRVLLSQVSGASESGTDETSSRQLSILEVPMTLGAA